MSYSNISKTIALTLGVLTMTFLIVFLVSAWTEPTSAPPGGNVDAPINVGITPQTKVGDLTAHTFYADDIRLGNWGGAVTTGGDLELNDSSGSLMISLNGNTGDVFWIGDLTGGSVPWSRLTSIPLDCSFGQYVSGLTSTNLTCSTPAGSGISGSGNANYLTKWTSSNSLGDSVVYENATGNVGIGTTSPQGKLHLTGTLPITRSNVVYSFSNIPAMMSSTDDGFILVPTGVGNDSDLRLYIEDDLTDSFSIYGNSCTGGGCWDLSKSSVVATFKANGNVGIGTTSPQAKLDVQGLLQVGAGNLDIDSSASDNFWIRTNTNTPNPNFTIGIGNGAGGWSHQPIFWNNYLQLRGSSTGANVIINDNGGNVGIGTASPTSSKGSSGYLDVKDVYLRDESKWASEVGGTIITYKLTANSYTTIGLDYCSSEGYSRERGCYCSGTNNIYYYSQSKNYTCPSGEATMISCTDADKDTNGSPYCECTVSGNAVSLKAYVSEYNAVSVRYDRTDSCTPFTSPSACSFISRSCSSRSCEMRFQCNELIDVTP